MAAWVEGGTNATAGVHESKCHNTLHAQNPTPVDMDLDNIYDFFACCGHIND